MSLRRVAALLALACLCVLLFASLAPLPCSALTKKGVGVKLSNADLDAIEDQWMEDEVEDEDDTPFKYTKTPEGARMPPTPNGPKTEMAFVTQMSTGGVGVRGYTIEDSRLLFVCDQRGFKDMNKVRTFVLRQKETVDFEWNSKKSVPGDVAASDDDDAAAGGGGLGGKGDPLAAFQAMQDEQAAQARREKRKAKKEREERQRKKKREQERKRKAKLAKEKERKAAAEAKQAAEQTKQEL